MVPDVNLDLTLRGKAHAELLSLEEFRPELWGLPPYPELNQVCHHSHFLPWTQGGRKI